MKQDVNYTIMRYPRGYIGADPVKSIEDRDDARAYAKRMTLRSTRYTYKAVRVKKG